MLSLTQNNDHKVVNKKLLIHTLYAVHWLYKTAIISYMHKYKYCTHILRYMLRYSTYFALQTNKKQTNKHTYIHTYINAHIYTLFGPKKTRQT